MMKKKPTRSFSKNFIILAARGFAVFAVFGFSLYAYAAVTYPPEPNDVTVVYLQTPGCPDDQVPLADGTSPTGWICSDGTPIQLWQTDGTHVWRATGNVGIGNASPGNALVVGDGSSVDGIEVPNGGVCVDNDGACSPVAGGLRVGPGGIIGTNSSNNDVYILPSGGGNVGIGTSSPGSLVHVSGGTSGDAELILQADTDNGGGENDNPFITFRQDGTLVDAYVGLEGTGGTTTSGSKSNALLIGSEDDNPAVQFFTNDAVRMTVATDGNVGIGALTPRAPLHVHAEAGATDVSGQDDVLISDDAPQIEFNDTDGRDYYIHVNSDKFYILPDDYSGDSWGSGSNYRPFVISDGKVGIGTASPDWNLEVEDDNQIPTVVVHDPGDSRGGIGALSSQRVAMFSTNTNDDLVFGRLYDNPMALRDSLKADTLWDPSANITFDEVMRVDMGNKRLGIGDSTPNAKLDVEGQVNLHSIYGEDPSNLTITSQSGYFVDIRPNDPSYGLIIRQNGDTSDYLNIEVGDDYANIGKNTSGATLRIHENGMVQVMNGPDNNGSTASLLVGDGNDTMYIDGNEIDSDGTLYLNWNDKSTTRTGGHFQAPSIGNFYFRYAPASGNADPRIANGSSGGCESYTYSKICKLTASCDSGDIALGVWSHYIYNTDVANNPSSIWFTWVSGNTGAMYQHDGSATGMRIKTLCWDTNA